MAVYFWAPWSHPCKQLDLVFAELAKEYSNAKFLRVDFSSILCADLGVFVTLDCKKVLPSWVMEVISSGCAGPS